MVTKIRRFPYLTVLFITLLSVIFSPVQAFADSSDPFYSDNDILFYDPDDSCSADSSSATSGGGSASGATYSLNQVKTFAAAPVTSTWNISDSTAEQWFLKQIGARPTVAKYKLNSGNIGDITSVVKAANVSPVFFYLYAVNEGGGYGGFINHYRTDTTGGGTANAKRDAEYIASQSQQTNGRPAAGGGEPADMPTAEAQAILNSLPAGSIGVIYIQATSAVTAELEDLSGKGPTSPRFGKPLSDTMNNIKTMGGDPTIAAPSSASSCGDTTATTTGFVYYSQYDPAWANKPYGSSTIQPSGCGPTSTAMVISTLTKKSITPDKIAKDFSDDYISGQGTSHALFTDAPRAYGLTTKQLSLTENDVKNTLQSGGLVIAGGTGAYPFSRSGHIIVIRAAQNGKFLLGNPLPKAVDQGKSSADAQNDTAWYNQEYSWSDLVSAGITSAYGVTGGSGNAQ